MSKIITVWGNPGSGKSVFCCVLAKHLTRDKSQAIIISADAETPMLPVWLPQQATDNTHSIGQIFTSLQIDSTLVAGKVSLLRSYPFIGVLGYAAGESPLSYPNPKYGQVKKLIAAAAQLVDYVILDAGSNITNFFMPAALELADHIVRLLTPDPRGIHYLKAHQPLLSDARFQYDRHFTMAALARPFHAIDEMSTVVGKLDGVLPYTKEVDRCVIEGEMFQVIHFCHSKYMAAIENIEREIQSGAVEDE